MGGKIGGGERFRKRYHTVKVHGHKPWYRDDVCLYKVYNVYDARSTRIVRKLVRGNFIIFFFSYVLVCIMKKPFEYFEKLCRI